MASTRLPLSFFREETKSGGASAREPLSVMAQVASNFALAPAQSSAVVSQDYKSQKNNQLGGPEMDNAGQEAMIFYIVCDESASMSMNGGIQAINDSLPELHATIVSDPIVVDKSRLSIIAFSESAEVVLPMSKATEIEDMPGVSERTATSYAAAFRTLRETIESDVNLLKSQGFKVHRPCAFFITDGEPTDDGLWQSEFQQLLNHPFHPHVISFGVDGAQQVGMHPILREIGTLKAFVGVDNVSPAKALAAVMRQLANTISASVSGAGVGGAPVIDTRPLDEIDGIVALDTL